MKKKQDNTKEIIWNLINSLLAGSLVFLGSLTSGQVTWQGVGAALIASTIVAITKFQHYWNGEQQEYSAKIFKFL